MKHASSIAALLLVAGCGGKAASEGATAGGLGSSAPQQASAPVPPKAVVATLDESVEYTDGTTTRKLWLSKDLVAEFNPSDAGRAAMRSADPGAVEVGTPQPVIRIWRLAGAQRGEAFARAVSTPALRVSPVLHEGPNEGLPMRALPGGVLATFKADWDRARIDAWLGAKSLAIEGDAVVAESNTWLVGTAPGLPALLVASELRKTGELTDVVPNFWRQNAPR